MVVAVAPFAAMPALFEAANAAGIEAANACVPRPMGVAQHANPLDDRSPVVAAYRVDEGVCGFAWVHFSKASGPAVKYMKSIKLGYKPCVGSGYDMRVSMQCQAVRGQSMERKYAFAQAFAKVMKEAGIECYAESRMD